MRQEREQSESERFQHLLIVEDNPGDRRLIEEAFTDAPFEPTIHTVSTGGHALEFIHRQDEYNDVPRPDVVLLDWSLPDMSGRQVLEELTAHRPEIPVVLMTGSKPLAEEIKTDEFRADAYLTKPDDPVEYLKTLQSLK